MSTHGVDSKPGEMRALPGVCEVQPDEHAMRPDAVAPDAALAAEQEALLELVGFAGLRWAMVSENVALYEHVDASMPDHKQDVPFPVSVPSASWTLSATGQSPSHARRLLRHALKQIAETNPSKNDDALFMLSELVTNAVVHGGDSAISLEIAVHDSTVLCLVYDKNAALPERKPLTDDQESGRGLAMVEVAADRWGYGNLEGASRWAKVVWFMLDVSAEVGILAPLSTQA